VFKIIRVNALRMRKTARNSIYQAAAAKQSHAAAKRAIEREIFINSKR